MNTRVLVFVCLSFLSFILAFSLFVVSQKVRSVEYSIHLVDKNVDTEKETLRVLNAEWHYLNRPERLEAIAKQGGDALEMNQVHTDNIFKKKLDTPHLTPVSIPVPAPAVKPVFKKVPNDTSFDDVLERVGGENGN
jgi:hypothetical protein